MIFYLVSRDEWESVDTEIVATPGPEGFVHCCSERQVQFVRRAYFSRDADIVALALDPTTLDVETRFEPGSGGEPQRFPHVYGEIPRGAVVDVLPVRMADV